MGPSVSQKKLGRKGVEAIFTSVEEQKDARVLIGVSGIVAGLALWSTVVLDREYPRLFGVSVISSYLSLSLASLGVLFVISGAGISVTFSRHRLLPDDDANDDLEEPAGPRLPASNEGRISQFREGEKGRHPILSAPNVKFGLIAFIQSCLLVTLDSGLVDEYQSNLSMQQWVQSVFPVVRYVLNWEAVLIASAMLGLLTIQFLPGRVLAS